jgi:hypothetical protein
MRTTLPAAGSVTRQAAWIALALLAIGLCRAGVARAEQPAQKSDRHSKLWGAAGERFDRAGRLPDFSFAGYHRGEQPLPNRQATVSVRDFGAVGDGRTDDTEAFLRALREASGQVIRIPVGTYLVGEILEISRSHTVLQGEGSERTRLRMVTPLNTIRPNWGATTTGRRTSNYSWSGGFIWAQGVLAQQPVAEIVTAAKRGSRQLAVSSVAAIAVGDDVRLVMKDDADGSLVNHLYQGDPGSTENLNRIGVSLAARVTAVDAAAKSIELDRALACDVEPQWSPTLVQAASSVEEVGVEGIGFDFPNQPYEGHFTELGFNAIAFTATRNCWIRDVRIHNCDSGIFLSGLNTTVSDLVFTSERATERSRSATGHHGITLGGQDNLLSEFDFQTRFMHDITVSRGSSGNVAMRGTGLDICLDHHRYAPHSNLFTEIDVGEGSRMFQSGGGESLGRHSAAWETFWGIRSRRPIAWPAGWGPELMNLVGLPAEEPAVTEPRGRWFEPLDPEHLQPRNLYQSQLARRLGARTATEL